MCLISKNIRLVRSDPNWKIGWKVFPISMVKREYHFQHQTFNGRTIVPQGKVLTASKTLIDTGTYTYPSGFHIYLKKIKFNGKSLKVVKVYYRFPLAKGKNFWSDRQKAIDTIVAQEMYVPVNKEKPA